MEQDLATLQVISEKLKEDPQSSQRTLAKKSKYVFRHDECNFRSIC